MRTAKGIEVLPRQFWQEVDPRFTRIVEIAGLDEERQKVQLRSGNRLTWADITRFDGRRGGYKLIAP